MASPASPLEDSPLRRGELAGRRVRLVGQFAGVSRRRVVSAVERHGAVIDDAEPDLLVVGEGARPAERDEALSDAARRGCELVDECQLWSRLGLVDGGDGVRRLYSPAMLAELVGAPLPLVRRWARRGYLEPTCSVQRLDYFDFNEARVARLLAELARQKPGAASLEREVERLAAAFPSRRRPLAELSLTVADGALMVRTDDALRDATGQRRLAFETGEAATERGDVVLRIAPETESPPPLGLRDRAWQHADGGRLDDAVATWRLAMLEGTPTAEDHQTLGDWLYAAGDPSAARERYYAALEVDCDLLPARVSLGCVLADLGELELAAAALRGALEMHEELPDAHFHLARALDRAGERSAARQHWLRFLEIAPESPWAVEARSRLGRADGVTGDPPAP